MDPLLHTRDEGSVKTMNFTGWTAPKKAKTVKSAGKVMATVFWDARSIIHIDYMSLKQTINGDYYALLDRSNNILKKKTSPFGEEESALPSRQCTDSHVPGTDGQIQRIPLRIASPSSIFARFSSLTISCVQTWRNGSEERDSPPESNSSPK